MKPRIAIYGTGRYGNDVVRMAHAKGWSIVAAFNRSGAKVGQDIGRLAGLDTDLGVVVENCDTAKYNAVEADLAIVTTSDRLTHNIEGYERLLTAGLNVLSHGTESYFPSAADPVLAAKIQTWAEQANVTFTASGIWDMSRIWSGILCAAPCLDIRSLHHSSRTNLGAWEDFAALAGVGFSHEEFQATRVAQVGPIGELYKLIPWHVTAALGYDVDTVVERREPMLFDRPMFAAGLNRDIPAGEPAGLRILVDVTTKQGMSAHAHIELGVSEKDQMDFMRWSVDGEPNSTVHVDRQVGPPGSATSLINRVHDVINAPPGIQEVHRLGPPKHSALTS
jgi:2,4-diaminopentanoate dehydrogenase